MKIKLNLQKTKNDKRKTKIQQPFFITLSKKAYQMLITIQKQVSQDKLTEAIGTLRLFVTEKGDKTNFNKALVIEMQYNSLQKNLRRGITEANKGKQELLEIALKILALADEIEAKS